METEINISIDEKIKDNCELVLKELGLDLETAINIFVRQVIYKRSIPFVISLSYGYKYIIDDIKEDQNK